MIGLAKILEAILILFPLFLCGTLPCSNSLPLSTNKRWIVDAKTGQRVKLACVNWPSHLEPMLAEGLDHKPLSQLVALLTSHHFTCVRLTWATYMFTRPYYAKLTVAESFDSLNLTKAKTGIAKNNPFLMNLTLVQAYQAVVDELGKHGLMVVADNHVSKPTWCCAGNDGNGFFGDTYFRPDEWLQGLTTVATLFETKSQVVAIGMRNELRGPMQNVEDWYKYIKVGAMEIHKANPDVLIFVSGLDYATNLTHLKQNPLGINIENKLVYEAHWYPWSWEENDSWDSSPLNKFCPEKTQFFIDQTGFVNSGDNPFPLFLGEFGVTEKNLSLGEDHFLSCFLAYAIEQDLDWGLWAWQGSYYFRQNQTDMEETFGILDADWNSIRNPNLQSRLDIIKRMNLDPTSNLSTSYAIFHPQSGSCVVASGKNEVSTAKCNQMSQWEYEGDNSPIRLKDKDLCLKAIGDGIAPILSTDCTSQQSIWTKISDSKLGLAARDEKGEYLCLHKESKILTIKCICIQDETDCSQKDPTIQWFKLVATNVN